MNDEPNQRPRRWLLISDIDDTLTGDAEALSELSLALEDAGKNVTFAVNSSRPAASVATTLANDFPDTLRPNAVITALGTEISVGGTGLSAWQTRFSGWPHETVFSVLAGLGHHPHDRIFQTERKVSFAVPEQAQAEARKTLSEAGIDCEIVVSGRDDFDVLPKGAGKAAASLFVASHFGIQPAYIVAAGDSGNDLDMLLAVPNRIVVGNARRELIDALEHASFYHATKQYAAGVHEGLRHFGVLQATARRSKGMRLT